MTLPIQYQDSFFDMQKKYKNTGFVKEQLCAPSHTVS